MATRNEYTKSDVDSSIAIAIERSVEVKYESMAVPEPSTYLVGTSSSYAHGHYLTLARPTSSVQGYRGYDVTCAYSRIRTFKSPIHKFRNWR